MGLTQELAGFIASLEYPRIPAQGIEAVKRGTADCLGVLFCGRNEPVVGAVQGFLRTSGNAEAHVLYDRGFASAPEAALINATAGHALDYDDTSLDGHPSVVLVPTLLAEGERLRANGKELICAYVAGYETWVELSLRDRDRHHDKGWHPTAVFGTLACAAAAARIARLDATGTTRALGIAASMTSGVVANFGSMMKPLQVGRAAQNGMLAARLAAAGITAAPDALEHPSGLLRAISPSGRVRTDGPIATGREWAIERYGINIKRYPVCYALHRAIDAALELRTEHRIDADAVETVEVTLGPAQTRMLRNHRPRTGLDAKFSAEFAMASVFIAGHIGMRELRDAFVASAAVQQFMDRVRITTIEQMDPEDPVFSIHDWVTVRMRDGTRFESRKVRHARGHARNPGKPEEQKAKFDDCVGDALGVAARDRLFERLVRLDDLAETAALYA